MKTFRPTRTQVLLTLVALFAAVGLVDSVLVHLKEIAALTNPNAFDSCKVSSVIDCGAVAKSRYSHFFGVPVSLFGIMYYDAFLVLAIAMLCGFRPAAWQTWGVTVLAAFSLVFSYWLLYVSYFGIGALCPYCLVSDGAATIISLSWFGCHYLSRRQ